MQYEISKRHLASRVEYHFFSTLKGSLYVIKDPNSKLLGCTLTDKTVTQIMSEFIQHEAFYLTGNKDILVKEAAMIVVDRIKTIMTSDDFIKREILDFSHKFHRTTFTRGMSNLLDVVQGKGTVN